MGRYALVGARPLSLKLISTSVQLKTSNPRAGGITNSKTAWNQGLIVEYIYIDRACCQYGYQSMKMSW